MCKKPVRKQSVLPGAALALLLVLLHFAAAALLIWLFHAWAVLAFVALELFAVAVAVMIQSAPAPTGYKLAWTLLLTAAPLAGLVLYLLWGGDGVGLLPLPPPGNRNIDRKHSDAAQKQLDTVLPNWQRASVLLTRQGFLLYRNTGAACFPSDKASLENALDRLEHAERFVFLECPENWLGKRFAAVLRNKAKAGVEVKIILDGVRREDKTVDALRLDGLEIMAFRHARQFANPSPCRDCRRILCVDGQTASAGGVLLDGPGAWGLTAQFIHMWEMLGGEELHREYDYYRPLEDRQVHGLCQCFGDGPACRPDTPAEDIFLHCIANAHRSLWLAAPRFIPDENVVRALCSAAESGVDVRLLLPGGSIAAEAFYEELLHGGVMIYQAPQDSVGTGALVADQEIALLGSGGVDFKSFRLCYVCGIAFYGAPVIDDVVNHLQAIAGLSSPVDAEAWFKRSRFTKMREKMLRAFSAAL